MNQILIDLIETLVLWFIDYSLINQIFLTAYFVDFNNEKLIL